MRESFRAENPLPETLIVQAPTPSRGGAMGGVRVALARTEAELEALYAFRYRIYVEEMNRPQKYADHKRRKISDPLDATGLNIVALSGGDVVGGLRSNLSRDGGLQYYEDLLDMRGVGGDHPLRTSISTRLMIAPEYRRSTLANKLFAFNFDLGHDNAIRWNFIDCNDHLVAFFERFGFVRTHGATHEEYGDINGMRIDIRDEGHLRRVGSPFLEKLLSRKAVTPIPAQAPEIAGEWDSYVR